MTTKKSTKTNKATNHDAPQAPAQEMDTTTPDQDKTTPPVEDTSAVDTPKLEPAASPIHQPAVNSPTTADKGDSDSGEAGDDPGPNMTSYDYDALHNKQIGDSTRGDAEWQSGWPDTGVDGGNVSGEHPGALLTAERLGLTPLQHVTAIIAGGVVGGMLSRTKPYEILDLTKVAETIGMCAKLADLILDLEDDPEDIQTDNQLNS